MRTTRTAAKAFTREWWPELLCAGLLGLIAFAGQPDDGLFSGFCAIIGGIFWAMGRRHRRLPLERQVREILDTTRRIEDRGLGDGGPQRLDGPLARVLPLRRK